MMEKQFHVSNVQTPSGLETFCLTTHANNTGKKPVLCGAYYYTYSLLLYAINVQYFVQKI
jgi:hypothetical protein